MINWKHIELKLIFNITVTFNLITNFVFAVAVYFNKSKPYQFLSIYSLINSRAAIFILLYILFLCVLYNSIKLTHKLYYVEVKYYYHITYILNRYGHIKLIRTSHQNVLNRLLWFLNNNSILH